MWNQWNQKSVLHLMKSLCVSVESRELVIHQGHVDVCGSFIKSELSYHPNK